VKFGIVNFPGSTGFRDVSYVLSKIMEQEVVEIWHKDNNLQSAEAIIIPGGSAFGDYLRPGLLAKASPVMKSLIEFANHGGFILGIGNGFQILCESQLLPGCLLVNPQGQFICKNVFVKADNNHNAFTLLVDKDKVLKIPIASAFGRYYADAETLKLMRQNHQILFRFCDENGRIIEEANPNGSVENIAGICNERKNVVGIMFHPERAADDEIGNTDASVLFESIISSLSKRHNPLVR
jgi:phosphoribosylformylglycinamidine synthase subunit PurQ / glutaminase